MKLNLKSRKSYEIDMCSGPILINVIRFSIPLMLSSVIQLLFNAVDVVVIGQFEGPTAIAAVGSTGSLVNLITNVFIGLSVGSNVLVARYFGARRDKEVSDTVHTAITISLIFGVFLLILGQTVAVPMLRLMGTPDNVIELSALYIKIYFLGMPAMILYNFGAAILRAVGDTKRPLYFLTLGGIINVVLNLIFVVFFHMGVAGVAIGTVASQMLSAFLVVLCLIKSTGCYHLSVNSLRVKWYILRDILRIGLPAGLQGAVFAISNVLIQSSVNSFGSTVMAGNTAASNIESFTGAALNSVHHAALNFVGQNMGGKKYSRVRKSIGVCVCCSTVLGLTLGLTTYIFATPLLHIFTSDPAVIAKGIIRITIMSIPHFIAGLMDMFVGALRGLGYSLTPTIVTLTTVCGFRVIWIYTVFRAFHSLDVLYLSYPITWFLAMLFHLGFTIYALHKLPKKDEDITAVQQV